MKQLLFLLFFPCFAMAQYQGNGNQKITLGEQTTADGLVYRGVENDTTLITPFSDTSAYIILDTINNKFYNYNRSTNVWSLAGGGGGGGGTGTVTSITAGTGLTGGTITTSGTLAADTNFIVTRFDTSSMLNNYYRSGLALGIPSSGTLTNATGLPLTTGITGVLPVANGGTGQTTLAAAGINTGSGTANYLPKYTATGTTLGNSLIYDNGSRVGISTASPTARLDVLGTIRTTGQTAPTSGEGLEMDYTTLYGGRLLCYDRTGATYLPFTFQGSLVDFQIGSIATNGLFVNASGSVGIGTGTNAQSEKLHVVGNARITGAYNVTTASAANVFVTTTGVLQRSTSSIKYKTDVEDYSKGLKEVMQLRPVTFKSINSNNDKTYAGFIAEELADLKLNELVENNDNDEPDAISYAYMVTLLTKAIQEQQEQISQLKKRLLILENK